MKAVIQVVSKARLCVDGQEISNIGKGLVVFFCVEKGDSEEKLNYFAKKIVSLRLFKDENDKTNLSVLDVGGEILLVSQFTLAGDVEHGTRPSFVNAEIPQVAKKMYEMLANVIQSNYFIKPKMGIFGADMKITQENDGPFTVILQK